MKAFASASFCCYCRITFPCVKMAWKQIECKRNALALDLCRNTLTAFRFKRPKYKSSTISLSFKRCLMKAFAGASFCCYCRIAFPYVKMAWKQIECERNAFAVDVICIEDRSRLHLELRQYIVVWTGSLQPDFCFYDSVQVQSKYRCHLINVCDAWLSSLWRTWPNAPMSNRDFWFQMQIDLVEIHSNFGKHFALIPFMYCTSMWPCTSVWCQTHAGSVDKSTSKADAASRLFERAVKHMLECFDIALLRRSLGKRVNIGRNIQDILTEQKQITMSLAVVI